MVKEARQARAAPGIGWQPVGKPLVTGISRRGDESFGRDDTPRYGPVLRLNRVSPVVRRPSNIGDRDGSGIDFWVESYGGRLTADELRCYGWANDEQADRGQRRCGSRGTPAAGGPRQTPLKEGRTTPISISCRSP